ncbi:hypothetical protein CF326_g2356 [Tilletia indica]|nr:hypothetical protein CF326_g2356 [Tilletia indica]
MTHWGTSMTQAAEHQAPGPTPRSTLDCFHVWQQQCCSTLQSFSPKAQRVSQQGSDGRLGRRSGLPGSAPIVGRREGFCGASRKGIKTGWFPHFSSPLLSSPTHLHTHSYTPFTPTTHPTKPTFNMSDAGRRDLTSQIGSNVKPDSQKSFVEQGKEKLDSLASSAQPESQKSTTQKIGDSVSGNSNQNQGSVIDSVKDTLGLGNNNKP